MSNLLIALIFRFVILGEVIIFSIAWQRHAWLQKANANRLNKDDIETRTHPTGFHRLFNVLHLSYTLSVKIFLIPFVSTWHMYEKQNHNRVSWPNETLCKATAMRRVRQLSNKNFLPLLSLSDVTNVLETFRLIYSRNRILKIFITFDNSSVFSWKLGWDKF